MSQYRYTGTSWYRNGVVVTAGDIVEPTTAELASFGDCLETVGEGDDDVPAAAGGGDDDPNGDVTETCDAELSSGGICGRELPCPYHSED